MGKKGRPQRSDPSQSRLTRILPLMGMDLLNAKDLRPVTDPDQQFHLYRNAQDYVDYDDLTLAAMVGDRRRVKDLVSNGANIEGSSKSKTTPFVESLSSGQVEIAGFLLHSGANPRTVTESGWTPLHFACSHGFEKLVAEIVDRGVDVDAKTNEGLTPLMLAARRRYSGIVKILLRHHAKVSSSDRKGMTALIHAATGDQDEAGGDFRCVEALVSQGADVNAQSDDGMTALMDASYYGDTRSVKLLLANNADVNLRDKQGRTALELAELGKNKEIARILRDSPAQD